MIPVGVGRGLLGSYARIVEQEIQDQKKKKNAVQPSDREERINCAIPIRN